MHRLQNQRDMISPSGVVGETSGEMCYLESVGLFIVQSTDYIIALVQETRHKAAY